MKRRIGVALGVLVIVAVFAAAVGAQVRFITIATGGTAGTYYPLGGAMAQLINSNVSGVLATAQSTGASVANVGLLQQGEAELAFIQNDIAYYAYHGIEMFNRSNDKLRGVAVLYPETVQIITRADSGIRSVTDLRDKRVAVGAPGSGTEANARQILAAYGMTYEDLGRVDYLAFGEAANNLRDGHIDAAFITAGTPTAAVTDLAASRDVFVVPISDEAFAALKAEYPFYTQVTIPAGTYKGLDTDVKTVAVMAMLATRADLPEDLVYEMTASIFDNLDVLAATHSAGRAVSVDGALEGMPIELHPGAARYFDGR